MIRRPNAYLAVELAGGGAGAHPAAWRLPDARPAELFAAGYWGELAALAEAGGLDFLSIGDSFAPPAPGRAGAVRGSLDAVAIAARIAPLTSTVGVVPAATVTHTEPFHLAKAIATLDFVSLGRAGWQPEVSRTQAEADLFGRKDAAPAASLWREAADAVEVAVRLWDSWEDDAVIRDEATGRYIDRDKLHYINFIGEYFSVKGPSITPRSPQAHPLIVVRADEPDALPLVGRWADVARVAAPEPRSAAEAARRVREAVAAAGRDPGSVAVLLDMETLLAPSDDEASRTLEVLDTWASAGGTASNGRPRAARVVGTASRLVEAVAEAADGADGVTVIPLALPGGLRSVVREVVPLLVERGLRTAHPRPFTSTASAGATLRDRFGLPRPENYFARKGSAGK